jgi:PPE-repeat protein
MTPGFDPMSIPGYAGALDTASKSILAKLSATGGNPFGQPGQLIDANKQIVAGTALPAVNEYQRLNLSAGGLGNLNAAIPALQQGAIGQQGNVLNSVGYGLNAIANPQPSLADMIKALNLQGLS